MMISQRKRRKRRQKLVICRHQ